MGLGVGVQQDEVVERKRNGIWKVGEDETNGILRGIQ